MDVDPWPLPVHRLVETAREVARAFAPEAAKVDREGVPVSHIDLLKSSGLLGVLGPTDLGGGGQGLEVFWAVSELLAAADLSTWFVQAQHHMPLRITAASDRLDDAGRERLLRPLCDGSRLSGVVFSQLRSHPRVQVAAQAVEGGWSLTGVAPWFTGWGLSDVALMSGLTPQDEVVMGFVPARVQPGLTASAPLPLAALGGTATVRLTFDAMFLAEEDVVLREPYEQWAAQDAQTVVNAQPAAFGVARAALDIVAAAREPEAHALAADLAHQLAATRSEALALAVEGGPLERRLALRVRAAALMVDAAQAAVLVGGGRSLGLDQAAQLLVRGATFLQVQAQTAAVRSAQLVEVRTRLAR